MGRDPAASSKRQPSSGLPTGGIQPGATRSRSCENRLARVPGLKVVAPSSAYDAPGLPRCALAEDNPVITVKHVLLYGRRGNAPDDCYRVPRGKAEVKRQGGDTTIVTYHNGVATAIDAADRLPIRECRRRSWIRVRRDRSRSRPC